MGWGAKGRIKQHFIIETNRMVPVRGIFGKILILYETLLPVSNPPKEHLPYVLCHFFLLFPEEQL